MKQKLIEKRSEISRRISLLENMKNISENKNSRCRLRLITELHTIDFALGKYKNIDSDEWFEEVEAQNASKC